MQSTLREHRPAAVREPVHVAIILDGNGRWALRRGLPRSAGHRAGARAVRRTVEAAARQEIDFLTLFAFSADNWLRPADEVATLMTLLDRHLAAETPRCVENGVRVNVIGRRDRLPPRLVAAIERAERATAGGDRMLLRIAVDYSARWAIAAAARRLARLGPPPDEAKIDDRGFERELARACHSLTDVPPVDLLIRTSGEQRLSDFLLWECAYAELYFTSTLWPDFGAGDLEWALSEFRRRERRFGSLPKPAAPPVAEPAVAWPTLGVRVAESAAPAPDTA